MVGGDRLLSCRPLVMPFGVDTCGFHTIIVQHGPVRIYENKGPPKYTVFGSYKFHLDFASPLRELSYCQQISRTISQLPPAQPPWNLES